MEDQQPPQRLTNELGDSTYDEGGVAVAAADPEAAVPPPSVPVVTQADIDSAGPRREGVWAALFYTACVMALGFPALAGKFLAGENSDQFIAGYAFREFGASYLKA